MYKLTPEQQAEMDRKIIAGDRQSKLTLGWSIVGVAMLIGYLLGVLSCTCW